MMSMSELQEQIDVDERAILDSIGIDERGLATPPKAPLEVLVRYTVFKEVASWIEDDFMQRVDSESESDDEGEGLEDAGIEASYEAYDVAEFAEDVLDSFDTCLFNWASEGEVSDTTLRRRGLGETREQVRELAKEFLNELI